MCCGQKSTVEYSQERHDGRFECGEGGGEVRRARLAHLLRRRVADAEVVPIKDSGDRRRGKLYFSFFLRAHRLPYDALAERFRGYVSEVRGVDRSSFFMQHIPHVSLGWREVAIELLQARKGALQFFACALGCVAPDEVVCIRKWYRSHQDGRIKINRASVDAVPDPILQIGAGGCGNEFRGRGSEAPLIGIVEAKRSERNTGNTCVESVE